MPIGLVVPSKIGVLGAAIFAVLLECSLAVEGRIAAGNFAVSCDAVFSEFFESSIWFSERNFAVKNSGSRQKGVLGSTGHKSRIITTTQRL